MQRLLTGLLVPVLVVACAAALGGRARVTAAPSASTAAAASPSPTAVSDLCPACRERAFTKSVGRCRLGLEGCAGGTWSGELTACSACAARCGRCAYCQGPLAGPSTITLNAAGLCPPCARRPYTPDAALCECGATIGSRRLHTCATCALLLGRCAACGAQAVQRVFPCVVSRGPVGVQVRLSNPRSAPLYVLVGAGEPPAVLRPGEDGVLEVEARYTCPSEYVHRCFHATTVTVPAGGSATFPLRLAVPAEVGLADREARGTYRTAP